MSCLVQSLNLNLWNHRHFFHENKETMFLFWQNVCLMHLCSHPLRLVVCGIKDLMSRKSCIENSCVPDILLCYLLSRCNIHCKLLDRIGAELMDGLLSWCYLNVL